MLNVTSDMRQGQGINKDRIYVGTVVDNNDPDKLSRIKVQIAQVFDDISNDLLPWVLPSLNHTGGASAETGNVDIPEIGSKVSIQFEDGNIDYPRYFGYHVDKKTLLEECKENYPDRVVVRMKNKCLLVIDKKTNEMFIRNPGTLKIYVEGDLELEVKGSVQHKVHGDYNLEVVGNMSVKVGGDTKYSASNINLRSSGVLNMFGASTVNVQSSGDVAITGSRVLENSGGDLGDPGESSSPTFSNWPGIPGGASGSS